MHFMMAVCCVPLSPLRAEPAHRSEMVSEQIFGECCEILEEGPESGSAFVAITTDMKDGAFGVTWCRLTTG